MPNKREDKAIFFIDAMLGNVARKLRLLGYDAKYSADIDDDKMINTAKKENRLIISKDALLVRKSEKMRVESILITKDNTIEQFLEIINHVKLNISQINGDTARCTRCNSETELVKRDSIRENIPHRIHATNEKFWMCQSCSQIYWEGTHIRNLQKFVSEINERQK